jgi:hypothetical protein
LPSFETDIRPLFRPRDILAMAFILDLASYDDVRENADLVLERIEDGTMPCDDPWKPDEIALLQAWIAEGRQP